MAILYLSWTTSWVTLVNGLQSVPQRVQGGIRVPQPSTPYTHVREHTTGPWLENEISRGGIEESHSAAVELPLAQLKAREHDGPANNLWEGLQVQDRIKSLQASILPGEVGLTGGQDVKERENESDRIFRGNLEIEM